MDRPTTDRRSFLASALAAGAYAALAKSPAARAAQEEPPRRLPPAKVSRDRVIRTVVGLRPYRPEGFVLTNERLGEKVVVHNYGHGGGGVSLSWGVAQMAAEQARNLEDKSLAVLGCGVIGLSTARVLQRRGKAVTVYTRELPPETTSNVAGALWYPTHVYEQGKVNATFMERYGLACRLAHREFQSYVGPEYGVRWMETYTFGSGPLGRELAGGPELYPETRFYSDAQRSFGFPFVRQFTSLMIEPQTYLRALLRDFYAAGGRVVVKELKTREEVAGLPERVVFNCTGLGARALFGDQGMASMRGQIEVLLPQPELDYGYLANSLYMFPRADGVILGGTFEAGNWSMDADEATTKRIIEGNAQIAKGLKNSRQ
ncbi:MAG: FAD-binding oxidoreductase [Acidobacteria bacterium]|nr:FAD-binding oxidoreductase [Acidobacteriota bacterium]MBV9927170.1 FAD-binding oxidoreductase [Acidobacteriota bacterium]